jgi:hypothetical protein
MATIKKPKKLKYPKKPKAGASISAMENYLDKRRQVEKMNKERQAAYAKAISKRATLIKQIAKL